MIGFRNNNTYMTEGFRKPVDSEISDEEMRMREKYKHVDGERVRFWSEGALQDKDIEEGDWLVWKGAEVHKVERIDIEEHERYFIVQDILEPEDIEGFMCFADMHLTNWDLEELKTPIVERVTVTDEE